MPHFSRIYFTTFYHHPFLFLTPSLFRHPAFFFYLSFLLRFFVSILFEKIRLKNFQDSTSFVSRVCIYFGRFVYRIFSSLYFLFYFSSPHPLPHPIRFFVLTLFSFHPFFAVFCFTLLGCWENSEENENQERKGGRRIPMD
jgi:hypothetical protein